MPIKCHLPENIKIFYEEPVNIPASCSVLSSISIGAYSYFGSDCLIGGCSVGRFCSIAPRVTIGLGNHEISHISTHPIFYGSKAGFANVPDDIGVCRDLTLKKHQNPQIGHDVWIGAGAIISRGVSIGTGAIIAAGSVVTKDVQPYEIVGGGPAKHIKWRFEEYIIERLLKSEWYNYELRTFVGLDSSDCGKFLDLFETMSKQIARYARYVKLSTGEVRKIS